MISMLESLRSRSRDGLLDAPFACDECERHFADAKREMGAFVVAVRKCFGPVAAANAAKYWVELAETVDLSSSSGRGDWRLVTIQAASRLAMNGGRND